MDYNSRKRPAPSLVPTAGPSLNMQNHCIVNSKNKRVCKNNIKTVGNNSLRTTFYCKSCNVYLCGKPGSNIFFKFHK